MPRHNKMLVLPDPGELWTNTIAGVDGIVVGHHGTVVTFASLTGVRAPVEFNRSYNPWEKRQPAPSGTPWCSRKGCRESGVVLYRRPLQAPPEIACPRHIPRGVQSTFLSPGQAQSSTQPLWGTAPNQVCPTCHMEAVEVLGEVPNHVRDTTLWMCPPCGLWWAVATRTDLVIHQKNNVNVALEAVPPGYIFKGITSTEADPQRRMTTLQIQVVPKPTTVITGPKPMTLFDHLIREDE